MSIPEFDGLSDDLIAGILQSIDQLPHLELSDIPAIDLYMDQVTTFMDEHLASAKRSGDDRVLTKTMINNYTKHKLLPPPVKKKYSRDHLLVLVFIYYFKGILSLQDIQSLLGPLTKTYFHAEGEPNLAQVYEEIVRISNTHAPRLREEVASMMDSARDAFPEAEPSEQAFLQYLTLICTLSLDVYIKKRVIEQLIDGTRPGF